VADIFIMTADGTSIRQLTNTPEEEAEPCISRDGRRIAYRLMHDDGSSDMCILDVGTGATTTLPSPATPVTSPSWNPSADTLVLTATTNDSATLYFIATDGAAGSTVHIDSPPSYCRSPRWSPAGDKIACVTVRDNATNLYLVNSDGSDLTRLTSYSLADGQIIATIDWSPDGQSIAYTFYDSRRSCYTLNVYALATRTSRVIYEQAHLLSSPAWAPDGQRILISGRFTPGSNVTTLGIVSRNGVCQPFAPTLTGVTWPTWSAGTP